MLNYDITKHRRRCFKRGKAALSHSKQQAARENLRRAWKRKRTFTSQSSCQKENVHLRCLPQRVCC